MRTMTILAALVLSSVGSANAQSKEPGGFVRAAQQIYHDAQAMVMKSAEKVGEDLYAFKPTPAVRSFAGILGHVADGNLLLCRAAAGENVDFAAIMKDPAPVQVHEKKTAKGDLIEALKESSAFCDSVFAKLTDATAMERVAWFGGGTVPKIQALMLATSHAWEHYGNLVTYMRLKDIVPPSSERSGSAGE